MDRFSVVPDVICVMFFHALSLPPRPARWPCASKWVHPGWGQTPGPKETMVGKAALSWSCGLGRGMTLGAVAVGLLTFQAGTLPQEAQGGTSEQLNPAPAERG